MSHFPLTAAFLCPDCSEVSDSSSQCACCGNKALLNLAAVLNRESETAQPLQRDVPATRDSRPPRP